MTLIGSASSGHCYKYLLWRDATILFLDAPCYQRLRHRNLLLHAISSGMGHDLGMLYHNMLA